MIAALLLAALLAQTTSALGVPQRPASGTQESQAKGTAVIKGRITAGDSGRPLRRARVTLTSAPADTRSTSTNIRGEYEFRDVRAGRYQLSVQRSTYLAAAYGQRRPGEPGKPLQVDDGATIEKLDITLTRASVISGRLVDETGEPVPDVRVWPMRREYFRGRRQLVPAGSSGVTDDVGQYRIAGVSPGEYVIMASAPRETWVSGPKKETYSYAPSFFPGTATAEHASRVKVEVGQEVPNVDFALTASRAASISGSAMRADGSPLAGGRVSLSFELTGGGGGLSMSISSATVDADGSWRMKNIAPGEYKLNVNHQDRDRLPERAGTTVTLQGADIEGLTLVADSGGTISGQVVTDDGAAPPSPGSGALRVRADTVSGEFGSFGVPLGEDNGLVGSDSRFTLRGVLGPSVIRVTNLPRGWVIKAIDADDRDFALAPVDIRGGATLDVRVVVTNKFPAVSGRITDDRGAPSEGVVLLVPTDTSRWFDADVLRSTRPDQSGLYRLESVRPGEYFAVALESVEGWQVKDPEFLEGVRADGTTVSVREGQAQQLNLRIRK